VHVLKYCFIFKIFMTKMSGSFALNNSTPCPKKECNKFAAAAGQLHRLNLPFSDFCL